MEKILYKKEGPVGHKFGQYEVDYVFLGKLQGQPRYAAVPEEIDDLAWVQRQEMPRFISKIAEEGGYFSPWFLKMYETQRLNSWWEMMERGNVFDSEGQNENKVTNML